MCLGEHTFPQHRRVPMQNRKVSTSMPSSRIVALLILAAVLLGSVSAPAQALPVSAPAAPSDSALLAQLTQATGGKAHFARHTETGKLRFLALDPQHAIAPAPSLAGATPELAARTFLGSYGPLFGLRDAARELTVMQQEALPGRSFVRFQQRYQGVPVLGGELIVQTDPRRAVLSVSGEIQPDLAISVSPRVTAEAAKQEALRQIARAYGLQPAQLTSSQPQLWIYNPAILGGPGLRLSSLVWRLELRSAAQPIREQVLVDAQRGSLALHFNQIADAKERVVCNDKNAVDPDGDQDNNCVPGKYVRTEGQAATGVDDVDLAYDYAGITYDYYFNHFGRDSLDGKGLKLISLVKYCPSAKDCPFQNANWDGQQMTYGDGFASADDVVSHELTHGFTEFTSHLFYYYQSGAINESMSDVFGELIDQSNARGNDTAGVRWLMGEDLTSLGVIRNMKDPTKLPDGINGPNFSPSPDATDSQFYTSDSDKTDSGGVHTNSGVNNKAAYLMTDGATFNGVTVTGLGADKVAALYYTVSTAFLTSASDYQDLASALGAACDTLAATGAYSFAAADCAQVRNAVTATKMAQQPPAATAPEAPVCGPSQTSADLFFDDMEDPTNGNWQSSAASGDNVWYNPPVHPIFGEQVYATSGKGNLWGDDPGGSNDASAITPVDSSIAMTRDIAIPAGAFLHFRHAFGFESGFSANYDGGVVEYSTNGGQSWSDAGSLFTSNGYNVTLDSSGNNPLGGRSAFGSVSNGYISSRLSLGALAGQQARFRFRIGVDELGPDYGWFIDDLRIYTCGSTPPVAGWKSTSVSVPESDGGVRVEVKLSGVTDKTVTIPVTASGDAVQGSNYRLKTGAVTVAPGQASAAVFVELINNGQAEADKTLVLTLGAPQNATLGTSQTSVLIQNVNVKLSPVVFIPRATK
jgi:Zn-dependent metalloprotease